MPILTDVRNFTHYRPRAIEAHLLEALRRAGEGLPWSVNALLQRLECYLQVTGQTLCHDELELPQGQAKLKGFVGALCSKRLEGGLERTHRCCEITRLRSVLEGLGATATCAAIDAMRTWRGSRDELQGLTAEFETAVLHEERVTFLGRLANSKSCWTGLLL
jgi:hypothetical protein